MNDCPDILTDYQIETDTQIKNLLIEKKFKLDEKEDLNLALYNLIMDNNLTYFGPVAEFLTKKDAEINAKNNSINTHLNDPLSTYRAVMAEHLGSTYYLNDSLSIHRTVIAESLIRLGADINAKNILNISFLHLATSHRYKEIVELLIKSGADINAKNLNGDTPLHEAASSGFTEITRILIKSRANINAKNERGMTPLYLAVSKFHMKAAEALAELCANIDEKNIDKELPISQTIRGNHREMFKMLIDNGADIYEKENGKSLLYLSLANRNIGITKLLIIKAIKDFVLRIISGYWTLISEKIKNIVNKNSNKKKANNINENNPTLPNIGLNSSEISEKESKKLRIS